MPWRVVARGLDDGNQPRDEYLSVRPTGRFFAWSFLEAQAWPYRTRRAAELDCRAAWGAHWRRVVDVEEVES